MSRPASYAKILRQLEQAERLRRGAVHALARLAAETAPDLPVEDELAPLLRRHRRRMAQCHGYRGHGFGYKEICGQVTSTPAITLFVRKKLSRRQLQRASGRPAPRWLTTAGGQRMATDVVELRVVRKDARICPGAVIAPRGLSLPGALACFAWNEHHQYVGVTAGHVASAEGDYVSPSGTSGTDAVFGTLDRSRLTPVDAATLLITAPWSRRMPNGSSLAGWRTLTKHDLNHTRVSLYSATAGEWSSGHLEYVADVPEWGLENALLYSSESKPGDSGGPVIDDAGYLIGVHTGRGEYKKRPVAIACAMERVVLALRIQPIFK